MAARLTGWTAEDARDVPVEFVYTIVDVQTRMPITSPVSRLSLSRERDRYRPANARLRKKVKRLILKVRVPLFIW